MGKGFTSTAASLRAATSPEDVRVAITEGVSQLGEGNAAESALLPLLEEIALDGLRTRQELRAATRAREVLLASVAHDLRNPLNTFAMSAGLLRDDLEGPAFDRTRALSLLARMERASSRMQLLIEDLLEASRIESGAVEIARRPEQGAALVSAAIAKAKPHCAEKGASVEEGVVEENTTVEVDRARTVDALVKLVAVALKSTGEGATIRIGVERHEGEVHFTIRATSPRATASSTSHDEVRSGLAFLIGRGLVTTQGGQLLTENSPEGPRTVASFPARV